jgi:hypothetical protein
MQTEHERKIQILKELEYKLWLVAWNTGSLHAWWDIIFDIDCFVKGKPTIVQHTADEWVELATNLLTERDKTK